MSALGCGYIAGSRPAIINRFYLTVAVVVEHSDWKDFGSYMTKLESDKDWPAFLVEINSAKAPNAVMVSTGISVEVPS